MIIWLDDTFELFDEITELVFRALSELLTASVTIFSISVFKFSVKFSVSSSIESRFNEARAIWKLEKRRKKEVESIMNITLIEKELAVMSFLGKNSLITLTTSFQLSIIVHFKSYSKISSRRR